MATPLAQARSSLRIGLLHGIIRHMDRPILAQSDYQAQAGARLKQAIEMLGITQVEAARLMGISKHVLRNWIAGDNPIQPYAMYRLHRAKSIDFNFVGLGDWSRLPHELALKLEAELQAKLAASPAKERQEA